MRRGALLIFGLLLAGNALAQGALAQTAPEAAIPNFFDPRAHSERPAPGLIKAIRFATTDDFPPFSFMSAEGRLVGFNIDLARAICRELAVPCTIQVWRFADITPALMSGAIDAALAGIAINAESRSRLGFSDAYLRNAGRFVQKQGAPIDPSADGLKGKRVAVAAGSAHEAFLKAAFPAATARPFDGVDAARAALLAGEADLHFGDGLQLAFWLGGTASQGCCAFAGGPYLESRYFGEGIAIATPRASADLRDGLNAALEALYANGTYAELYLRYFPIGFY